jgi:hypothetical protein
MRSACEGGSEVAMDLDRCVHHDGCQLVGPPAPAYVFLGAYLGVLRGLAAPPMSHELLVRDTSEHQARVVRMRGEIAASVRDLTPDSKRGPGPLPSSKKGPPYGHSACLDRCGVPVCRAASQGREGGAQSGALHSR